MNVRKVPMDLQGKVKRFLEFQFKARKHSNVDVAFLHRVSPWIRIQLADHLHRRVIAKHPFFRGLGQKVFMRICSTATVLLCAPSDVVVQCGELATCMYCIVKGKLVVLNTREKYKP